MTDFLSRLSPEPRQLKKIIRWAVILSSAGAVILLITVTVHYISFLTDKDTIEKQILFEKERLYGRKRGAVKPLIRIYSGDNTLIGELLPEKGSDLTMKNCTDMKWMRLSVVSAEDREFYNHGGISFRGVLRAMLTNLLAFDIRQGAGSVTMQTARVMFTDRSATVRRKLYEIFTAFSLEKMLSKDEILCLYMNHVYMGEGRIGAEEASWYYFRKPPEKLTVAEAAMITGLFPSPMRYSPQKNIKLSLMKQGMVLDTLIRDSHLTEEEKTKSLKSFMKVHQVRADEKNNVYDPGTIGLYGANRDFRLHHPAPDANQYVKQFLYENLPEETVRAGNLKVYTTIDSARQSALLQSLRAQIRKVRSDITGIKKADPAFLKSTAERLQGVMLVMDPSKGDILALSGGFSVDEGNMNLQRIFSMKRQPGSVIKGFLYAAAMDEGILSPDSMVTDEPVRIGGYSPRNWYAGYKGEMTLRNAVSLSVNTVPVKTLHSLGVNRFLGVISRSLDLEFGEISDRFPDNLSLALGSGELSPIELARMYSAVSNGGWTVHPRIVLRVEDAEGGILYDADQELYIPGRVLSEEAAAGALYLMRGTTEDESGTAYWMNKNPVLAADGTPLPVASKTGTVQSVPSVRKKFRGIPGVKDAWFLGIVPGEISVVWIGHDEGAPFPGSGSASAGAVWYNYARTVLSGKAGGSFPEPEISEQNQDKTESKTVDSGAEQMEVPPDQEMPEEAPAPASE